MNAAARPDLTLDAFEHGTLDPDSFDHAGHIYVAWLYLERYPLLESIRRYTAALRDLTAKLGVPQKYHETITCFFLIVIAERRDRASSADWFAFRRENPDLFDASRLLGRHYSKGRLMSDRARRFFVLPDKLAESGYIKTNP